MKASLQQLFLTALMTTRDTQRLEDGWLSPCLHCGKALRFDASGGPRGNATLEHVVPRSWFGKRAAAELTALVGEPNSARNLGVACARCNQGKGRGHDAAGPANMRAREVVTALLQRRLERLVEHGAPLRT